MASRNGISMEERLARVEQELKLLKKRLESTSNGEQPWWKSIVGTHENDPDFAEIVRLGREIREKDLAPVFKKKRNRTRTRKSKHKKTSTKG